MEVHSEQSARIKEVSSLLAAETDLERLRAHLTILRDTMTPADAAQTLALAIRGGERADILPIHANYAFDAVTGAFGRAREAATRQQQEYTPSDADRQQVADLFAAVTEKMQWMGCTDTRRQVLSAGLHGFLNQNREFSGLAVPVVSSLLAAETDLERLRAHLTILRDTMTPADAAQTLALAIRGGERADILPIHANYAFDAVTGAFGRAREAATRQQQEYTPSDADRQQVADLFAAVTEKMQWMGCTDTRRQVLSAGLHGFLNQNREFKDLAKKLLEEVDRGVPERLIQQVSRVAPQTPVSHIQQIIDRGTAREVSGGIERFLYLQQLFGKLPEAKQRDVRERVQQAFISSADTRKRAGILDALFKASESQYLARELHRVGASLEDIAALVDDDAMVEIISIMADHAKDYRFQLGALLTQIPADKLPQALKEKLKAIIVDTELKLKPEHGVWWLCGMAEPRLRDAMRDGAVMLINGRLLLKFNGKFSALCLESFSSSNGATFLEGNWYSPTDRESRDTLRERFDRGQAKGQLRSGEWAIMRPLARLDQKTPDEVLEEAREFAGRMSDQLPDRMAGFNRRGYREAKKEEG